MNNQMNQDTNQVNYESQVQPNYVGAAPVGANAKTNTLAILGFILSIILGFIGSILCFIALSQIKKTGEKGKGFAIAGIIIGLLPLVAVMVIGLIFYFCVWPNVQANLNLSTACSQVDNNGFYESKDFSYGEDGYAKCEQFSCEVFYKGKSFEMSCLDDVESDYYYE